jgi:hypothetical protein
MTPEVTEFRCHELSCPDCGTATRAELPAEAASVFGIRLSALASALMVQYRLSKRLTQRLLADVLGVNTRWACFRSWARRWARRSPLLPPRPSGTSANNSSPTPTRRAGTRARRTVA